MRTAAARARANIALIKYWGKADKSLNLPATGSISMTLSSLQTTTRVTFDTKFDRDEVSLNSSQAPEGVRQRISRFLSLVRSMAGIDLFGQVDSHNNFPTAAGLASSASGYAALAVSASRAAGLDLSRSDLSQLARQGSGSAPRSLIGGFVELGIWDGRGTQRCSLDQIASTKHWDIRLVIAVCGQHEKKISSGSGMERSRLTSDFYEQWIKTHNRDLDTARQAVKEKDISRLGPVVESSCFKMHAVALSSQPPLLYWNPITVAAMQKVWSLRETGLEGYVTIDAGPQVKVLCEAKNSKAIAEQLEAIPGVEKVFNEQPGSGVELLQ
ncbi:MAG: diphosphomevalonate decarboxylase [Deltaproteobacteria bacterium]|nr:diphosphomevalonate decarboxylase [Deltaproteobacteria bacterium]